MKSLFPSRTDSLLRGGTGRTPRWRAWLAALGLLAGAGSAAQGQSLPVTTGLRLHLKADAGITSAGGSVSAWADQSGNGFHASQASAANQPLLVATSAIGGRPAVRFNDGSVAGVDFLNSTTATLTPNGSPNTVFMVGKAVANGGSYFTGRRTNPILTYSLGFLGGGHYVYSNGVSAASNATTADIRPVIQAPFISSFRSTGPGVVLGVSLNGTARTVSQSAGMASEGGAAGYTVGTREDLPTYAPWVGDVAELLVFDRALTAAEQTQVETYLSNRYNIPTAANPTPTMTAPPVTTGLRLHLAADAGITSSAGSVSAWADQSGNGFDAGQATAGAQPALTAAAVNGKPALTLDGSDDFLQSTASVDLLAGQTSYTFFTVLKPAATQKAFADIFDYSHSANVRFVIQQDGSSTNQFYNNGVALQPALPTASFSILGGTYINGGTATTRRNGGSQLSATSSSNTFGTPAAFRVGNWVNGGREFNGQLAEVLVYNRVLSAAEIGQVESFLAAKYAISLAAYPSLTAVSPLRNAPSAPRGGDVSLTFSEAMSSASASATALKLFGSQTGLRAASYAGGGSSTLSINPTADLRANERVDVTVTTAALSDANGNALTRAQVSQFIAAAGPATGTLAGGSDLTGANRAVQVATADFDNDGDLDLVAANYQGGMSRWLNNGDGTFAASTLYGSGQLHAVTTGDIDNDGDADVVAAQYSSSNVLVFTNTGSGFTVTTAAVGSAPTDTDLGDIDGDGDLDLVASNYSSQTVSVRFNNGSGGFSGGSNLNIGTNALGVELADCDYDGDLDLAASRYGSSQVYLFTNDGSGGFGATPTTTINTGTNPGYLEAGDLDNDGFVDLVIPSYGSSNATIAWGNGLGGFPSTTTISGGSISNPVTASLGDLDGDGDLDFGLSSYSAATVSMVRNLGGRSFGTPTAVAVQTSNYHLILADLNNDQALDMASANYGNNGGTTLSVRLNTAVGPPTITAFTPTGGTPGTVVTLSGTNLHGLTSVSFNGTGATTFSSNPGGTQATVTVPAGASTGLITVVNGSGSATTAALATPNFTVLPAPTISGFTPTSAPAGTAITITGTNLTGVTGVLFGGVAAASFSSSSNTSLTAAPATTGASGPITLIYGGGSVSSASAFTLLLPNVTKAEYFLDTDPGFGQGSSVAVTAAPDLANLSFSVALGSLTPGFHRLGVRSRDAGGHWSLTGGQSFYYEPLANQTAGNITRAEYFLDTDPGFGQGTNVAVTASPDIAGLVFNVSVSGLSAGFHRLGTRVRDANGKWSLTTARSFYFEPNLAQPLPNVTKAEYFLDTDPGFGQGTPIALGAALTDLSGVAFSVDLTSLTSGFHRLSVRSRDASGRWSLTGGQSFYYEPVVNSTANLTRLEYFLDTDPGFGLGTALALPGTTTDAANVGIVVPLGSLSAGFHSLQVRSKDSNGKWSLTTARSFYYEPVTALAPNIVRVEYFFDTDPGFGNGTAVAVVPPTPDVAGLGIVADASALADGPHRLSVRSRDASGRWSLVTSSTFVKNGCGSSANIAANLPAASYSQSGIWSGSSQSAYNGGSWNAGGYSGSITADLGSSRSISELRLMPGPSPNTGGTMTVYTSTNMVNWTLVDTYTGAFTNGVELLRSYSGTPLTNVRGLRLSFSWSSSWVAVSNVGVYDFNCNGPAITSFSPTGGAGGTTVVISGTNLSGVTGVTFNGTPVAAGSISANTATSVTVVAPAGGSSGQICLTAAAGSTCSAASYVYPPVIVTGTVSPTSFCSSTFIQVPFTTNFSGYAAGNQFGFQLSDANGVFTNGSRIYGRLTYQSGTNGIVSDTVAFRTPAGSGYRVRVVATNPATTGNANGVNLTVYSTPLATAAATPTSVAYNGSFTLTAGPLSQSSYQWYVRYPNGGISYVGGGQSLTVNNAQVSQSGRYFVYVSNATGCQDTASVRVTVNPSAQPILTLSQFGGAICAGAQVGISFAVNGNSFAAGNTITAQLSDAAGNFGAPVSIGAVAFAGQGNGYLNTLIPTNTPQGSAYRIRLVGSNPSVTSAGDNGANLTINERPVAVAGSNSPVPYGGTIQLTAQTVPGASYQWFGPGFYSTLQNPTIAAATINQHAGTYQLVVTLNGCQSTTTTNVTVSPSDAPILTMAQFGSGTLCAGSSSFNIGFNVTGNSFAAGNAITAQLSDAAGSFGAPVSIGAVNFTGQGNGVVTASIPASTPTGSGYRIRLVGSNPGVASQTDNGANLPINTAPTALIVANNSPVPFNGTVTLTAQAVAGASYLWSVPGVGNVSTGASPTLSVANATPGNGGTYGLTVLANGCSNTTSASVTVLPAGQPIVAISQFGATVCAGASFTVGFNVSGASFAAGTTLTAQLSDDNGNFGAPVAIGTVSFSGQGNGSVAATIPANTIQGGLYRIRLVASNPATMSPANNGQNISISTLPAAVVTSNNSPVAAGGSIQLTAQAVAGASYQWVFNSSVVGLGQTLTINNAQATNAGTYTLVVTLGTCPNSTTTSVTVTTPSAALATNAFGGSFCPGSPLSVPFTAAGFNGGNVFTAQLSNASGSFAAPVSIGSVSGTSGGTIAAQIPAGTANGTGYRIRVVASSPGTVASTDNGQNLTVDALTFSWTGAVSTDWFNPSNWSCGQVPTSTSVVVIPGGVTFYPVITGNTAAVLNLTVQVGATFSVGASAGFYLHGNVTVFGTMVAPASSSWYFAGNGNQFVYGNQPFVAGNVVINNNSVLNAGNFLQVWGNWNNFGGFLHGGSGYGVSFVGGGTHCVCGNQTTSFYNFTVGSGNTVNLGIDTGFAGNVVVDGTFSAATYGIVLNGTGAQFLGGLGTSTFYNVTINNTLGSVTLNDDITVLGNWLNNGVFVGSTYSVIFANQTVAQIIGGSVETSFYNITFNNPISVTLHQNIYVLGGFVNTGVFYGYYVLNGVTNGFWVRFGGSTAQVITAGIQTYFYHFYVESTSTVSLATNIYIAGNYYLYTGIFNPGTYTVYFNGTENLVQTVGGNTALTFYGWNIVSGAQVRVLQNVTWLGGFVNAGSFYGYNLVGGVYTGYTCTFGGSVAQVLSGLGLYEFWHVAITNLVAGGVTFNVPTVYVLGNWINNGVFFCGTGTVYFNGTVAQLIQGSSSTTFYHVSIGNTLASVGLGQAITVLGNWLGNGRFLGNTHLVYFHGTAAQTIFCGNVNTRFYDVRILNPVSVTLLSDIYLNGSWTHDGGFIANGFRVYFTGTALQLIAGTVNTVFHHLTIALNANVRIDRNITLLGNWVNNGAFLANGLLVYFNGTVAQTVGGTTETSFHHVTFNNPVSVTLHQNVFVLGNFLNQGVFYGYNGPTGYFVRFGGTALQVVQVNATTYFHHFYADNSVGVQLGGHAYIAGNFYLYQGAFNPNGYTCYFNGAAQTVGGYAALTFYGWNIASGATVTLNQHTTLQQHFANAGTFLCTSPYVFTFAGSVAQVLSGTGTFNFWHVTWNNLLGITLQHEINVFGNWLNTVGFLANGQLVTFKGSVLQLIGGSISTAFHHLTILSTASVRIDRSISLLGNWINDGIFFPNSLLVTFNGTVLQTIAGANLTRFYDLTLNNNINVSLGHDIDVTRHFVNLGGFCGCGYLTRFNGTVPQTITCTSGRTNFHDITFANNQGVTMLDNVGVSGNWVNLGGYIANGYLVLFNGTALQTIGGTFLSVFHHMSITNTSTAGVTLLRDVHLTGNWINNGRYCGCGFATVFNGSTPQGLTCTTGNSNFHHLTLANTSAGGVTLTGNINVAGNWLVSGIWNPQTHMVFFNGTAGQSISVGGSISQAIFHGLTISNTSTAGVSLGCPLFIRGNWVNNGVFVCGTNTVFAGGTSAQTFGGSAATTFYDWTILNPVGVSCTGTGATATVPALGIQHVLTMASGSGNLACGGNLTLLSNATGTAMVVNQAGGGECTGTATVERFISGLGGSPGYRHYSSPMRLSAGGVSTTVQEFADDLPVFELNPAYNTAGNTVTPFPTLFKYQESRVSSSFNFFDRGWMVPAANEDLQPLRGYTAQTNANTTVDIKGVLQNGPVSYSVTRGSVSESGWELIGNPYPAPMDWDVVRSTPGLLTGVADAIYVHKPTGRYTGSYASYVNGLGQNGGSKDLASMQGFFVRATQASGSVSLTNAVRATAYASPVFNRQAQGNPATALRPVVRLEARTAAGLADETVLYFEAGAGLGVSPKHDAHKVQLNGDGRPSLWSLSGTESLAINGLPDLASAPMIPLGVRVSATGTHQLVLTGLSDAPAGTQVWLEDRALNRRQNLATNGTYTFQMAANYTGQRFYLNFVAAASPLATTNAQLEARTALYPNPTTGQAQLELSGLQAQGAVQVDVVNTLGQVVLRTAATPRQGTLAQVLDLSQLPSGIYSVRVHAQEGTVVKRLVKE